MAQAKAPAKKAPAKKAPAKKKAAKKAPAADKQDSTTKTDKQALPPVNVRCTSGEQFRRAGRAFGPEFETVTDYTQEQLDAWVAEPRLEVEGSDASG